MKRFLFDIFIFTALLLFVLMVIKKSVPFYWGNTLMENKISYILDQGQKNSSFFFGSSRTYRHIEPKIFDDITNENSYNLGCPGALPLEINYLLENFTKVYSADEPVNIYLQEFLPKPINKNNLHSVRSKYYFDFKRLKMGLLHFYNKRDYTQVYYHLISYIENLLCIGEIGPVLNWHFGDKEELNPSIIKQKGFLSLDEEFGSSATKSKRSKMIDKPKREMKIRKLSGDKINISEQAGKFNFYWILGTETTELRFYYNFGHYNAKGAKKYTEEIANTVKLDSSL